MTRNVICSMLVLTLCDSFGKSYDLTFGYILNVEFPLRQLQSSNIHLKSNIPQQIY
jgi:hypothetical protein